MDAATIEKIEGLVKAAHTVDVEGKTYSAWGLKRVYFEPRATPIQVKTLTGFVDFMTYNIDALELENLEVHIESHKAVSVFGRIAGEDRGRDVYLRSELDDHLAVYPFEKFMAIEPFVIALRSMFEPSEDREKLISYVSKVRGGASFSLDDDGVSQTASVTKGVSGALTEKETAPAIVKLRPFRTFREIEQVESEFLFRMKLIDTEEHVVGVALFEADGGRWRNDAILTIKEYLGEKLPNMAIIA